MHALRKTISIAWKNYKLFMPIPNEHSPPRQKSNDPPLRTQQTKPANNSIVLVSKTGD